MKTEELLRQLKGYMTINQVGDILNVNRQKAIYLIHRLRKKGYVRTTYRPTKERMYYINKFNRLGGTSYVETMNQYSPIGLRLATREVHRIYGRRPSAEETLLHAMKQQSIRWILGSLSLFRHIKNWSMLYCLAKRENRVRDVAALYTIARIVVPRVRKMPKRFRKLAKPKVNDAWKHIVESWESDDLRDIEKKWKVYIPLNKADLESVKFEYAIQKAQKKTEQEKRR